ncbi:MAG: radical SAM protein [Thermoplasmatales archaeon]|nr:MAG: radical SAM protein [Thermoplasmatales archaeon]
MTKKKKIFIYGILTCNRRKLDAWKLKEYFLKNNYKIVTNVKDADIILLSTCAYSNKHAKTSLEMTKKFLDFNAELIVVGCLPDIEKEELAKIFNGKTLSTKELKKIDKIFPENKIKFKDIKDANTPLENANEYFFISNLKKAFEKTFFANKIVDVFSKSILKKILLDKSANCHRSIINYGYFKYFKEKLQPSLTIHKDSYFIRPSWGCLGTCSYCVIKKAIGPLKSKPLETIIDEFKKGLNLGYSNFIFDADDLGAYGVDLDSNFAEMLDKITDISGDYSVHLRYIHPTWIVKYCKNFEKILKKGKIKSLGSAIQSGSPRILRLMHRFSDVEKIKSSFSKIKNAYPKLLIATECINGFPSETEEDFKETIKVVNEISFDWGFVFPFSCRPGSLAEKIEPKVSNKEILERMKLAGEYFNKIGYNSSSFKNHDILVFSKTSTDAKLDEGLKSFCFSTIE